MKMHYCTCTQNARLQIQLIISLVRNQKFTCLGKSLFQFFQKHITEVSLRHESTLKQPTDVWKQLS